MSGNLKGFWSYVHNDDDAEGGRIVRLAHDVVAQYEMLTGETISLFLDKDSLELGDAWRESIDSNLATTAFFIAVVTPRYFMKPECRRELQAFVRKATKLGVEELILPLHYINIPALDEEDSGDDLIELVKKFQWDDWRTLRLKDISSEDYRTRVAHLAQRLVDANKKAEKVSSAIAILNLDQTSTDALDESPGLLDKLAEAEDAVPKWTETLEDIRQVMMQITDLLQQATTDSKRGDAQGQGFSARLFIARRVANQLRDPAERIYALSNVFASQLHSVDNGYRVIIEQASSDIKDNPGVKASYCAFMATVRKLVDAIHVAFISIQTLIEAFTPLEKMARDLRPVLRRLREGLTIQLEAQEVASEWIRLIDASGIACDNSEPQDLSVSD